MMQRLKDLEAHVSRHDRKWEKLETHEDNESSRKDQ